MTPRYTVRIDKIPHELRRLGFVAWINDAQHPDGSGGSSCAFSQDIRDAERIAAALNRDAVRGVPPAPSEFERGAPR